MADSTCGVEECDRAVHANGWCGKHNARWKRTGDPRGMRRKGIPPPPCLIEACSNPGNGGWGWCEKHYRRWQRHGDPMATSRIVGDDPARFESYIERDTSDCWLWTGVLTADGYSVFPTVGVAYRAGHVWAYTHLVGPVPDGLELDHLCRVRRCCNPDHLEAVTHAENVRRARAAALT